MEALSTKAWPWAWTGLNEMVRVSGDDCAGGEGEERNGRRYEDSRRGPGMYMAGAGMGRMKEEEWKNEYMADSLPMNIGGEQIRSRSDTRCEVSRSPTVKPTQHSSSLNYYGGARSIACMYKIYKQPLGIIMQDIRGLDIHP